ncbi:MAG: hypothetical protein AABZ06_06690 [Bdellovibrionota bacterium]
MRAFLSWFILACSIVSVGAYTAPTGWEFIPDRLAPLKSQLHGHIETNKLIEVLRRYYGASIVDHAFKVVPEEAARFLALPEVLCRAEKFSEFYKTIPRVKRADSKFVLSGFKNHLGKTLVFRGITFENAEASLKKILAEGLGQRGDSIIQEFGIKALAHIQSPDDLKQQGLAGARENSPFQSFTEQYHVARRFARSALNSGYIFVLEVDEFDLIRRPFRFGKVLQPSAIKIKDVFSQQVFDRSDPTMEMITHTNHTNDQLVAVLDDDAMLRWIKKGIFSDLLKRMKTLTGVFKDVDNYGPIKRELNSNPNLTYTKRVKLLDRATDMANTPPRCRSEVLKLLRWAMSAP